MLCSKWEKFPIGLSKLFQDFHEKADCLMLGFLLIDVAFEGRKLLFVDNEKKTSNKLIKCNGIKI